MPERIVTVYRFQERWREAAGPAQAGPRAGYEIECGAGTYVRSLVADLKDAYCLELRRTGIGPFDVSEAVPPPRAGSAWREPPLLGLQRALDLLAAATRH